MSILAADNSNSDSLRLVVDHVFMPPELPQKDPGEQIEQQMNVALCKSLMEAAQHFLQNVSSSQRPLWIQMIKMMELAHRAAQVPFEEAGLKNVFSEMAVGSMSI
jgi:hypothetical protein